MAVRVCNAHRARRACTEALLEGNAEWGVVLSRARFFWHFSSHQSASLIKLINNATQNFLLTSENFLKIYGTSDQNETADL